ncbi:alpha/beta hydrolase [Parvibaculum sp.]|uniref:alpha/beta fold hydrolase n=1 Tax=Parvibaculum sp. TaxID=2024848 RepID=UPI00320CCAB8
MSNVQVNGITLEYESFGPEDRETILLIMGLGAQLTQWPLPLCEALVARGYRVIRFDNRDAGLSTKFERGQFAPLPAAFAGFMTGKTPFVPYTLYDMVDDTVGLLDALGIDRAHIVGSSMGGMIAQLIASEYPERTLSLTSIMSTSGNALLPPPKPRVMKLFVSPAPPAHNMEAIIERGIATYRTIGSPAWPTGEATLREWVTRDAMRSYCPSGVVRQAAAAMTNGDRRPKLRRISVPTVVLHGDADPLVPVEGGRDTAANIPGAELRIVEGMGHDIPLQLVDTFADAIVSAAERATGSKEPLLLSAPDHPVAEEAPPLRELSAEALGEGDIDTLSPAVQELPPEPQPQPQPQDEPQDEPAAEIPVIAGVQTPAGFSARIFSRVKGWFARGGR